MVPHRADAIQARLHACYTMNVQCSDDLSTQTVNTYFNGVAQIETADGSEDEISCSQYVCEVRHWHDTTHESTSEQVEHDVERGTVGLQAFLNG